MLVRYGGGVVDARGSLAGNTASRNSAGAYLRARVTPTNPQSAAQANQRAIFSQQASAWNTALTIAQRLLWEDLGAATVRKNKLGEGFNPSGFNIFMRSNTMLELTGQTAVTAPPVDAVTPAPTFTIDHTPATGVQISGIGQFDLTPTMEVLVSHSPSLRQTINYFTSPFGQAQTVSDTDLGTLPHLLIASANLVADTRIFFRSVAVTDDGSVSFGVIDVVDVGPVV